MRQTIRQLLLFPIGFCMVSTLFQPTHVPIPSAFAAAGDPPITMTSPAPTSRLMSGIPALRRLTTPPNPAPAIALNSIGFSFSSQLGNPPPPPEVLTVSNRGGGILNWNATTNTSWLTLSPASGTGNGAMTIAPVLGSLGAGTYTGNITVSAPGAQPVSIPVTFIVTLPVSSLTLSSNSITFTATRGSADPAPKNLTVTSNGSWTVSTKEAPSWLSLTESSGQNNGTITAKVDTSKAKNGENQATVTVASGGIIKTVTITLMLNPPLSSSVTLTWKANSETDLAGYKVYRSTISGRYEQANVVEMLRGNVTTYQVSGLEFGKTYFFVVTAFDIAGNESGYSNEVSKSIY